MSCLPKKTPEEIRAILQQCIDEAKWIRDWVPPVKTLEARKKVSRG